MQIYTILHKLGKTHTLTHIKNKHTHTGTRVDRYQNRLPVRLPWAINKLIDENKSAILSLLLQFEQLRQGKWFACLCVYGCV